MDRSRIALPFFLLSSFRHEMHGPRFIRSPPVIILLRWWDAVWGLANAAVPCNVLALRRAGSMAQCPDRRQFLAHPEGASRKPAQREIGVGWIGPAARVNTRRADSARVRLMGCAGISGPLIITGPIANPSRNPAHTSPTAHHGGPQPAGPRAVALGSASPPLFARSRGVASTHKLIPCFREQNSVQRIAVQNKMQNPSRVEKSVSSPP